MKRKLVAALLGIAASVSLVSSAHAQGRVFFNNYGGSGANSTFAPVNYGAGAGGTLGAGVNSTFTAGLWYFLGTQSLAAGNGGLPAGWEVASITQQFNTGGPGSEGIFVGGIAQIADYVSGPITFSVVAYNGTSYNAANTTVRGNSAGFAGSPATGQAATQNFGPALQSFAVTPIVPEPSIFALSGLGAAALMLIRRKK